MLVLLAGCATRREPASQRPRVSSNGDQTAALRLTSTLPTKPSADAKLRCGVISWSGNGMRLNGMRWEWGGAWGWGALRWGRVGWGGAGWDGSGRVG